MELLWYFDTLTLWDSEHSRILFSEGCALYLWQIRQFPDNSQYLRDRHSSIILPILAICPILLAGGLALGQDEQPEDSAAQTTFQKALAALAEHKSIEATLLESILISEQPLKMTGRYLEQDEKSRLELQIKLTGNAEGSLLEVVDGDVLWNQTTIGESRQVTLRNLKQISAALAELPAQTASNGLDLGLGGLSGLMRSLERTMDFSQQRAEGEFIIVQGRWKSEFLANWQTGESKELPQYVPDTLRISFDTETLFPRRLLYLKRVPGKEALRPFVKLEFQNVKLGGDIDEAEFEFTPPEDIVPDDVTTVYIDQLKRRAGIPEDAPKTDETPKK